MAIKKRITKGHKSDHKSHFTINKTDKTQSHQINQKEQALEKVILALFLVFVIIATMILFKAPVPTSIRETLTGKTLASIALSQFQYNVSERLKGTLSLQLEEGDLLPATTKIDVFISSNATNCSLKYICPNNVAIDWHSYDTTTGSCIIIDPDPESTCCAIMGSNCLQLILNSKFDNPSLLPSWSVSSYGISPEIGGSVGVVSEVVNSTGDVILENALFLDSTISSEPNSNISVFQNLGSRAFKVKELVAPSQYINLTVKDVKVKYGVLNGSKWTEGKVGSALKFDGSNDSVNVMRDPSLEPSQQLTVETWVKMDNLTSTDWGPMIVSKYDGNYKGYTLYLNGPNYKPTFSIGNGTYNYIVTSNETITINQWYHIVGIWNGTNISIYVNGVLKNVAAAPKINHSNTDLFIGRNSWSSGGYLNGTIDEVRIYNRFLSADEVSQRYNGADVRDGLVAEFKFDENNGSKTAWGNSNVSMFNAQMIVDGVDRTNEATFTWSQNPVKGLLTNIAPNGRTVKFIPTVAGRTTITVTGNWNGRTATMSKAICVYFDSPDECYHYQPPSQQPTYASEQEKDKNLPELYFQTNKQLKWKVALDPFSSGTGYAFEVIVKGKTPQNVEKALHYWYNLGKTCPYGNSCISKTVPQVDKVLEDGADLYNDWVNKEGSPEDTITEIWLVSHGKFDNYNYYGQRVYFDNIELRKYGEEPSLQCTARNKKCCLKGSGIGNFYEQFVCPQNQECWDECGANLTLNLAGANSFISLSSTPQNFNKTDGICQAIVEGTIIQLYDSCYSPNQGYTACLDTSNESCNSALCRCRNWNNLYVVNLSSSIFNQFKVSKNGTYSLNMRVRYKSTTYPNLDEILIYETSAPFTVGVPGAPPGCPDEQNYNCINAPIVQDWGSCIAGTQTRAVNCSYNGTNPSLCPAYKVVVESQACNVTNPCTENNYSCDSWQPEPCSPQSTQTRICTLTGTCDPNAPGATEPAKERTCDINVITEYIRAQYNQGFSRSQVEKSLLSVGWSKSEIESVINTVYGIEEKPSLTWLWIVIIVVVVAAAIVVVIVFVLPKSKKGKPKEKAGAGAEAYPELTSYIKDALAAGATKQEITTKLQEAGWPKDAIEESFKAVG